MCCQALVKMIVLDIVVGGRPVVATAMQVFKVTDLLITVRLRVHHGALWHFV
jgi:hypothetical protein